MNDPWEDAQKRIEWLERTDLGETEGKSTARLLLDDVRELWPLKQLLDTIVREAPEQDVATVREWCDSNIDKMISALTNLSEHLKVE